MKVCVRPRQGGKTAELIRLAAAEFLYVVCPDREQVRYVQRMARDRGHDIPMPLTWNAFTEGTYYGQGIKGFVIDNLDMCVQQMAGIPIRAVSLTDPEAPLPAAAQNR